MYTTERHVLELLSLLKKFNIRKIIVSPGSTNIPFSGSVQRDNYFEVYSCVDERSAAYMAVGLAEKSGEPVVITCTGATASRNYLPGLTEAFYRGIPVIAVTFYNGEDRNGHLVPQNINRSVIPKDVALLSVSIPIVHSNAMIWAVNTKLNQALVTATRPNGGPVHINMSSDYSGDFSVSELPDARHIIDIQSHDDIPLINSNSKIVIFVGSNPRLNINEIDALASLAKQGSVVVLGDLTSGLSQDICLNASLVCSNHSKLSPKWKILRPTHVIHIGEVSGDYFTARVLSEADQVIRVSKNGLIQDTGKKLSHIFKGSLDDLLSLMPLTKIKNNYTKLWYEEDKLLRSKIPELPLSNVLLAQQMKPLLPENINLHLAILNSLRSWNFFQYNNIKYIASNVGGFGIDGALSSAIGGALADPKIPNVLVVGDLAFFYDLNSILSRHLPRNLLIILVNNGCGIEFNNKSHIASKLPFSPNEYIAAGGHFNSGSKGGSEVLSASERSKISLAKAICNQLSIQYDACTSKEELPNVLIKIVDNLGQCSRVLEVFTSPEDESDALEKITNINRSKVDLAASKVKELLPADVIKMAKKLLLRT